MQKEVKKSPCHPEAIAEGSYEILHYVQNDRPVQSGRTLMETLGTLAIMGILSIAGIWAYGVAMDRHKANTLIQEAQKRAVIVAGQIGFNNQKPNLSEFNPPNPTSGGTFEDVTTDGLYKQFGIKVSGVKKAICENILRTIGESTPIRRLSLQETPRTPLTTCNDTNNFLFIYNEGMTAENDTQYCEDDSICNADNECMICDAESNMCKNGCEKAEYLESTGTEQRISTGITIDSLPVSAEIGVSTDGTYNPAYQVLAGTTTGNQYIVGLTSGNPTFAAKYNNFVLDTGVVPTVGTKYTVKSTIADDKLTISIDGTEYTATRTVTTSSEEVGLFGQKYSTQVNRIYQCKLWKGDVLVRDFIPVLSPESSQYAGAPCMFDKVTKKLFCNQGTGDFKTNLDD